MKPAIATAAGIIIIVLLMMLHATKASYQEDLIRWQNKYAQSMDSLTTISIGKDSALVQLAQRVDKIKTDNEAIEASLKENKASLRYWASMAASYKAELDEYENMSTADSVVVTPSGDSLEVRSFGAQLGIINVAGNFDKYDPWDIRFSSASIDSLSLKIGLAENRDGTWNTYIADAPPGLHVRSMNALVSPYVAPWYTKIHLSGEMLMGTPLGVGVGAGYGPWTGKIYGTTAGVTVGAEYTIYPFRRNR